MSMKNMLMEKKIMKFEIVELMDNNLEEIK